MKTTKRTTKRAKSPQPMREGEDMGKFITVKRTCELTSMCERAIRKYIANGHLPAFYVGTGKKKSVRVKLSDAIGLMKPMAK